MLLPGGAPGRTAKRVLAVFCMLSVLSPLFALPDALFAPAEETEAPAADAAANVLGRVAAAGERRVREEAERFVAARTDVPFTVSLSVHTEGETDVYIDRVTLAFASPCAEAQAITEAVTDAFGIPAGWEVIRNDGTAAPGA